MLCYINIYVVLFVSKEMIMDKICMDKYTIDMHRNLKTLKTNIKFYWSIIRHSIIACSK